MQVEGNSGPIHLNPPVGVLSTCTVLLGLILISTLGSRGRLTLPTMTNSPRDMLAVVINISACALSRHVITQASIAVGIPRDEIRSGQPVLYEEMRPGLTQQAFRLADMDVGGIEASLCFPNTFVRFCGQRFLW